MRHQSKAGLFLMELMISIVFFAFSAAISLQLFMQAKTTNEESLNINHAAIAASSIAECYRSNQLNDFYQPDQNGYVYFDDDWSVKDQPSTYQALLKEDKDVLMIQIYQNDEQLYTLSCMRYQQRLMKEGEQQ